MMERPATPTDSIAVVVAMPISRILLEDRIQFSEDVFAYPPGEFQHMDARLASLNPQNIQSAPAPLRQIATELTGISWEIVEKSPLLVFPSSLPANFFKEVAHSGDLTLLEKFSAEGERYMDRLRFAKCALHLPETLPGRVGTWDDSQGFSGALAYDAIRGNSYLLGGQYLSHYLCIGIGLDPSPCREIPKLPDSELGFIVTYALRLFTSALEAPDATSKFVNSIRLFEYLADPNQNDGSNKWDVVRKSLCLHIAKDKNEYLRLSDRFRQLGNIGTGGVRGYREQIIHHGRSLEDIISSRTEMKALFKELQSYAFKVIGDFTSGANRSWSDIEVLRQSNTERLGI